MTDEEWETIWNDDRIIFSATGHFGTVRGWEQNSLTGRTFLKILWDHLPTARLCYRTPWQDRLEVAIDAMKLYEELSHG